MKPIDERQPEEQDPQYEELMTLLQKVNLDPRLVDPQERTRILAQARTRLFQTNPEIFKPEHIAAPALREPGSFPSKLTALAGKPLRGRRLPHVLTLLAAVLVVAVLFGASLLLFQYRHPVTNTHFTKVTGTYANSVATNGIMFGFDAQHTHFNPFEHVLNPTTVGGLKKKWASAIGGSIVSSPTVAGGVVYIGCVCGYLYALDAVTGMKKWTYPTGSQVVDVPAVVGGVVYFGTAESHTLYALDAATGAKKWTYQTRDSILSSPTVVGGIVYVGSDDNTLYALDAATGAKKWAFRRDESSIDCSPVVADGVVYVGAGNLYAFHLPGT
jgi:glucose dehydrogenase